MNKKRKTFNESRRLKRIFKEGLLVSPAGQSYANTNGKRSIVGVKKVQESLEPRDVLEAALVMLADDAQGGISYTMISPTSAEVTNDGYTTEAWIITEVMNKLKFVCEQSTCGFEMVDVKLIDEEEDFYTFSVNLY